jgi:hypothetical protein
MKKLIVSAMAALMLSGCATTMYTSTGVRCEPHGIANADDQCPYAKYEVRPGNAALGAGLLFFGPLGWIGTGYILGWNLWGPVKEKGK